MKGILVNCAQLLVVTAVLEAGASATEVTGAAPTGVVSSEEARFCFPLRLQETWEWYLSTTPDNRCEYSWTVEVSNEGRTFTFGYMLFKFPGSRPTSRDFSQLLAAGQISLFEASEGHHLMIEDASVNASAGRESLIISITDPNELNLLFAGRPARAVCTSDTPAQEPLMQEITIQYE